MAVSGIADAIGSSYKTTSTAIDVATNQPTGSYDKFVSTMPPIQSVMVRAGTAITPTPILTYAAQQGSDFKTEMGQNGDLPTYNSLPAPVQALVTVGEAIPRTFMGISPYEAGRATRQWLYNVGIGR